MSQPTDCEDWTKNPPDFLKEEKEDFGATLVESKDSMDKEFERRVEGVTVPPPKPLLPLLAAGAGTVIVAVTLTLILIYGRQAIHKTDQQKQIETLDQLINNADKALQKQSFKGKP